MERSTKIMGGMLAAVMLAGLGWWASQPSDAPEPAERQAAAPGKLSGEQIRRLGIATQAAVAASSAELGTVPAVVTLPPEARVAVTAPFGGSVVRLFVVNGQAVAAGQPLAIVRSIEPVQYGAALARGQAQLAVARANAARTGQLAHEGIIAGARADEARAALREAEVAVAENRRILAQTGANAGGEMTLRAPISGRLAAVAVQTGGPVDGLTAPFVIENTASFMLDLQIPERLVGEVHPGMVVELAGGSGGIAPVTGPVTAPVTGTIISVGSSIDPATRSVLAKARIAASPLLVSGKSVMAVLKGSRAVAGVSVPSGAVTQLGGKDVVFVANRQGFVVRPVAVAGRSGAQITLASGLQPGERVATSGLAELKVLLGGE